MPRWSPRSTARAFENLQTFLKWYVDYGRTTACCQRASDDDPVDGYDCAQCELRRRQDALWVVNQDAWRLYQALCGRTVSFCQLHGLVIEKWTQDWPVDQVVDLIHRLDCILDFMQPAEPTKPPESAHA